MRRGGHDPLAWPTIVARRTIELVDIPYADDCPRDKSAKKNELGKHKRISGGHPPPRGEHERNRRDHSERHESEEDPKVRVGNPVIAATPVIGTVTYLVTSFGKPFTANGFGMG